MGEASLVPRRVRTARARSVGLVATLLCALLVTAAHAAGPRVGSELPSSLSAPDDHVAVVVRERSPRSPLGERHVDRLGGRVTWTLPIVGGFAAEIPVEGLPTLERSELVAAVWRDGPVTMS